MTFALFVISVVFVITTIAVFEACFPTTVVSKKPNTDGKIKKKSRKTAKKKEKTNV